MNEVTVFGLETWTQQFLVLFAAKVHFRVNTFAADDALSIRF